jgi:hypothetical protein
MGYIDFLKSGVNSYDYITMKIILLNLNVHVYNLSI